ncbi:MAG: hypothetical protein HZA16_10095 [Nitrospirae bacterium]|nr:hypothetical protein [Nitrospirota bacterium]
MKTTLFCIALIFFISGCQTSYIHPDKNAYDFERDKNECEKIAKYLAAEAGKPDNPFFIDSECQRCLEVKFGWKPKN